MTGHGLQWLCQWATQEESEIEEACLSPGDKDLPWEHIFCFSLSLGASYHPSWGFCFFFFQEIIPTPQDTCHKIFGTDYKTRGKFRQPQSIGSEENNPLKCYVIFPISFNSCLYWSILVFEGRKIQLLQIIKLTLLINLKFFLGKCSEVTFGSAPRN